MKYFGMVSTRHSVEYTAVAIESFFRTTRLEGDDRFFLIDNDGSLDLTILGQVTLLRERERSFAQNVNRIMAEAEERGADLYFLNNDLVFTPHWIDPLLSVENTLLSPLSNREAQYHEKGLTCSITMDLPQYRGREAQVEEIAERHRSAHTGYTKVLFLPFFCIKIPFSVYSVVGRLDESFGLGGGEDNDYCLRALLAGFSIAYANSSYVIHFNGKSTWEVESEEETEARCSRFRSTFESKWNFNLLRLFVDGDSGVLDRSGLRSEVEKGNFMSAVATLASGVHQ